MNHNHAPNVEEITKKTYDRIAVEYCRNTPAPGVRQTLRNWARSFISQVPKNSSILIIGAGDGRDSEWFLDSGHRVTLLDYSPSMLELARKRVPNARALLVDFRNLPFNACSFDGVWASACLYHVRKRFILGVVSSLFEIIRPNGVIYMNLRKGVNEYLDPNPRSYPTGGPRFYAYYSQKEVLDLISRFEILRFQTVDPILKEDYFHLLLRKSKESTHE